MIHVYRLNANTEELTEERHEYECNPSKKIWKLLYEVRVFSDSPKFTSRNLFTDNDYCKAASDVLTPSIHQKCELPLSSLYFTLFVYSYNSESCIMLALSPWITFHTEKRVCTLVRLIYDLEEGVPVVCTEESVMFMFMLMVSSFYLIYETVDLIGYLGDVKPHGLGETWTEFLGLEDQTKQRFHVRNILISNHTAIQLTKSMLLRSLC